MSPFREMCFTPAEFAAIAKIDKSLVPTLESAGVLKTVKRRMGNVERKMITLEEMRNYFQIMRQRAEDQAREMANGDGAVAAGPAIPVGSSPEKIALATGFIPEDPTHKIQMFYNVKGGTGKSTLTAQYVMRAAMNGLKVLAVDLDGQGHLTVNLDVLDAHERPTVYDVLINDLPLKDAIMNVAPGLDLVPANLGLCNIEIPLNQKTRREYRLKEALAKVASQYDLIVADTNPAASILNGSMLVASDLVNVVCATNPLSFHGMSLVMATIEEMEREFSRQLDVRIIPNLYDSREVISQEVLGELRAQFEGICTKAVINRTADLNEATKRRSTVWDVNPKGIAAQDMSALTEELLYTPVMVDVAQA
ncbi:MAG: ParA family protein [Bdellovibrionales bacterium]|nr:ParA family protein [Bdellovibrionales bacterium]